MKTSEISKVTSEQQPVRARRSDHSEQLHRLRIYVDCIQRLAETTPPHLGGGRLAAAGGRGS